MDPDGNADNTDLQRRVLQSTLEEVAAREEQASECCVICLEVISEPCEVLPCGHYNFDYVCVLSWLYETPLCPLCKGPVSSVRYGSSDKPHTTLFEDLKLKRTYPPPSSTRTFPPSLDNRQIRPPFRRSRTRPLREYGLPVPDLQSVSGRRKDVYAHQRYSKHVGSNRLSLYRELTPVLFCNDNELVSRARMWIRRELQVFSFLTIDETETIMPRDGETNSRTALERRRANNAEFLLEYIIAILKSVDIMGSAGQAEEMLSDFLGRDNTRLFLHELRAWLRSPFTKLEDWDRAVQYSDDETTIESGTRQSRNRSRYASDRYRDRYKRRGDFYRPNNTTRDSREKGTPSRYEPYRNRGGSAKARA